MGHKIAMKKVHVTKSEDRNYVQVKSDCHACSPQWVKSNRQSSIRTAN